MLSWISLMKIRNNNGPNTVPYGIPDVTATSSDLTPSRTICWVRCVKKYSFQPKIQPSKPVCCTFNKSHLYWCGTLSNAFQKSMITRSICFLWSKAQASSSINRRSWVSQTRRFRKPCWISLKGYCFPQSGLLGGDIQYVREFYMK